MVAASGNTLSLEPASPPEAFFLVSCLLLTLRTNALLCLITDLVSFSGVLFSLASFSSWSCLFFCYSSTALAGGYSCVTLTLPLPYLGMFDKHMNSMLHPIRLFNAALRRAKGFSNTTQRFTNSLVQLLIFLIDVFGP